VCVCVFFSFPWSASSKIAKMVKIAKVTKTAKLN